MPLGLSGMAATEFWRTATAVASAVPSAFDPQFTGGVFVATQSAGTGQIAKTPTPGGPVPIPYPNTSVGKPVNLKGAGQYFDGQYVVTSVQHGINSGSYSDGTQVARSRHLLAGHKFTLERHLEVDLIACLLAAASGDQAAAHARETWAKVKPKVQQLPPAARRTLLQELSKTLQRGR